MLKDNEKLLVEAIDNMLQQDAKLGLSIHNKDQELLGSTERGYEYLHGQIDEMFALKASELTHAEGVCQSFKKAHSYKYLDDPSFKTAMMKEMVAQAIPAEERKKALDFIPKIIKELKTEQKEWAEKDFGLSPALDEIREASKPGELGEFDIIDNDLFKSNVKWDKGDASPSRTP